MRIDLLLNICDGCAFFNQSTNLHDLATDLHE